MERPEHRRVPKQERSRKKYEEILDTAANLFLEKGFEGTTTNEIAARAGISIGSVYQYFDNKEAIVSGLTGRYIATMAKITDEVMATEVADDLPIAIGVGRVLDPIIEFHASHPEFRLLWTGADRSPELRYSVRGMDDEVVRRAERLLRSRAPGISNERARLVVGMMHLGLKALLNLIGRSNDTKFNDRATAEVKRMLSVYVGDVIREESE